MDKHQIDICDPSETRQPVTIHMNITFKSIIERPNKKEEIDTEHRDY